MGGLVIRLVWYGQEGLHLPGPGSRRFIGGFLQLINIFFRAFKILSLKWHLFSFITTHYVCIFAFGARFLNPSKREGYKYAVRGKDLWGNHFFPLCSFRLGFNRIVIKNGSQTETASSELNCRHLCCFFTLKYI